MLIHWIVLTVVKQNIRINQFLKSLNYLNSQIKIVSLFANIVNSNPEYEDKFFIINRNYNTPIARLEGNGQIGHI